jgi:hypothetical protein
VERQAQQAPFVERGPLLGLVGRAAWAEEHAEWHEQVADVEKDRGRARGQVEGDDPPRLVDDEQVVRQPWRHNSLERRGQIDDARGLEISLARCAATFSSLRGFLLWSLLDDRFDPNARAEARDRGKDRVVLWIRRRYGHTSTGR